MKLLPCIACIVLGACGGSEAAKPVAPHAESAPPGPADAPPSAPAGAAPQAPGRPLALTLSVEHTNDGMGLHVLNRGPGQVSLAAAVALEKKVGDAYKGLSAEALKLRFDCASQGCVTLAPGAELIAPAWLGRPDGERCDALAQVSETGSYRFVVRSCTGNERAELPFVASAQALIPQGAGEGAGAPK